MRIMIAIFVMWVSTNAFAQSPACSDARTINQVKRALPQTIERILNSAGARQYAAAVNSRIKETNIRLVRTTAIDKSIGKYYCAGEMEARFVSGEVYKQEIEFTSQMTDDKKEQIVQVSSVESLATVAVQLTPSELLGGRADSSVPTDTISDSPPSPKTETAPLPARSDQPSYTPKKGKPSNSINVRG